MDGSASGCCDAQSGAVGAGGDDLASGADRGGQSAAERGRDAAGGGGARGGGCGRRARGQGQERLGPLHGLPIAIKDLQDTAGIRTTYGSAAFADHVPAVDGLVVQRLKAAGAIVVGKTNTPEFGVGSHTFNEVFGATRNPWAPDRSAGGSSGGAGAALAAGLIPIADGSDHGGSIRNPASFNNVVGLRPTPGLVPDSGSSDVWDVAAVVRADGPYGRRSGADADRDQRTGSARPRSRTVSPATFAGDLRGDLTGLRIAWCPDLGGLPIEPEVLGVLDGARARLTALGCDVRDVAVDLGAADEAFETLRAVAFVRAFAPILPTLRQHGKGDPVVEHRPGPSARRAGRGPGARGPVSGVRHRR